MENRNSSEQIGARFQSTTHLDFKQAMQDFQTMFPEMDQDVIEEVLRANKGAVDATIDHLLSMTTDNLNESLRLHLEKMEEGTRNEGDTAKNECLLLDSNIAKRNISSSPLKKWSPPLIGPLPPTFLRIQQIPQKVDSNCEEDERIALFLQNEEFLSELRVNQDFMSTLDQDVGEKNASGGGGGGGPDIELFKERLRNMGKISRNKFSQLSKVFQRRKKSRSAKGILNQSASGDSILLGSEPFLLESQEDSCPLPVPSSRTATANGNAAVKQ